jgi:FtsP/CotA-like multicopper oxidase with cupredoxin domain
MQGSSGHVFLAFGALIVAIGCAPAGVAPSAGQPSGWDDGIRLPAAADINPDPGVVELNLEARPAPQSYVAGGPTMMWTFDGLVPGPLIRARVGNRVVVHFSNGLPEETTIHWHGLRISAAMDGMPDHSQPPIQPGGGFVYDFVDVLVPPAHELGGAGGQRPLRRLHRR